MNKQARTKKDIERNLKIMMDCLVQKIPKAEAPRSKLDILRNSIIAEDTLIDHSRAPSCTVESKLIQTLEHAPRSKSDVRRNALKLTGEKSLIQPPRLSPEGAPRTKSGVKRNGLKLSSVVPNVRPNQPPTGTSLRHKGDMKRMGIKANEVLQSEYGNSRSFLEIESSTNNYSKNSYNYNSKIAVDLEPPNNDSNRLCRFCLRQPNCGVIRIAWHSWKDSNLALLFEQITNIKLHISKDCSELCCIECSRKLHKTFQAIQLFRETNAFWQEPLIINTKPIEEVKLDELEYTDEDELIEYLDNAAEDEIIVDEPVVDDITEYELPNGDTQDAEVDLQSIIPAIEYDVQTTVETIEENNFDCKICDKVYKTARGLAEHTSAIHESMDTYCELCNKKMSTAAGLRKHMQNSHGDLKKDLECKVCGNISTCFNNWKAHQLIHNRSMDTITPCDQCDKVFTDNRLMKAHKRIIHAPYVASMCNECGKVFGNRKRLHAHMLLHDTPKLQCDHCKIMFKSKKYIIEHMRIVHGQGLPHICDKCGQEFRNRYTGRKHTENCLGSVIRLNRNRSEAYLSKNSLNCQLCMRPYLVLATLQNHYKNKHTVEECEFLCMQCNQIFTSPQAFSEHKNSHGNLKCKVCKIAFLSEASLRKHMDVHLGGKPRFECKICGGSYARLVYLKMHHRRCHTTERPFKCDGPGCDLAFADYYDLLQHKKNIHAPISERPYVCNECGARYITATRLRYHMVNHTGIGTHKCAECGEHFRYVRQLQTHIIAQHAPLSIPGKA